MTLLLLIIKTWYCRWLPIYISYHNICFHLKLEECSLNYADDFQELFYLMALDKKKRASLFIKWPPSWFFRKLQSILNWIISSSYICKPICAFIFFTYFSVNHTDLPKKIVIQASKTQDLGHSLKVVFPFRILNSGIIPTWFINFHANVLCN